MQFKHPEILWALLLLLIPILIHLLQLRRFKKTPFTNVAMLQRVVSESRKSQNLKKWLLLLTRLFLLAALIIAFAQPFSAKENVLTKHETVIYLDNSFSMQAKKDGMSLLSKSIQDLIQEVPEFGTFTLFTNERTYRNVTLKQVQNDLLALEASTDQLDLDQIAIKASSLFSNDASVVKDMVLISDLQRRTWPTNGFRGKQRLHLIQPLPDKRNNVYIDSLYLGRATGNQVQLQVQVVGLNTGETLPISLYDGDRLIAKTAVKGNETKKTTSLLSLEIGKSIKGKVVIEDPILRYDNHFYFNIDERKKPKVLAISGEEASFLERIFSTDEFEFKNYSFNTLKYSILESQNTIILNGLKTIPNSLSALLRNFAEDGGTLVVIPAMENLDLEAYNRFLQPLVSVRFEAQIPLEQSISSISFGHPLYQNVFERKVVNFDYPKVTSFHKTNSNGATALSYADGSPFLVSRSNCFVFTASLARENSNFINSPLVVPTFYNIGEGSLKNPSLYQTIGRAQSVDIGHRLGQDNIVKLRNLENEFIPQQQSFSNKVRLTFGDNPKRDGIYAAMDGNDTLQNLSFNFPRDESALNFLQANDMDGVSKHVSIPDLFEQLREDTSIVDYWKWFVIFALLFAVLELLIQKLLP